MNAPGVSSKPGRPRGSPPSWSTGRAGRSNNFLIDGTENNDISVAGQGFKINNPDAVQEVSVQNLQLRLRVRPIRRRRRECDYARRNQQLPRHGVHAPGCDQRRCHHHAAVHRSGGDREGQSRCRAPSSGWSGTVGGPVGAQSHVLLPELPGAAASAPASQPTSTAPSAAGRAALNRTFAAGANPRVDLFNRVTAGATATDQMFSVPLGDLRPDIEFGTAIVPYPATYLDRQTTSRVDHIFNERNLLSGRFLFDDQEQPGRLLQLAGLHHRAEEPLHERHGGLHTRTLAHAHQRITPAL